jgi:hypothetical protein
MFEDKYGKISKMIQNLELVQNVNNPSMMKVAGEDINFAQPVDEFSRLLIAEIPNFYKYMKIAARLDEVSEFNRKEITADIDDYLNWLNTKLEVLIIESEFKNLLERE